MQLKKYNLMRQIDILCNKYIYEGMNLRELTTDPEIQRQFNLWFVFNTFEAEPILN